MGGIIRAFKMDAPIRDPRSFAAEVSRHIGQTPSEARITFGLGTIGVSVPIFSQGLRLKKDLKDKGFNLRLVNKDDQNLVSAVVKKEGLVATATEFFLLECGKKFFLAHTIHIQDIDAYSERDLGKSRDMAVGMLPPKLAQSMIHLALGAESIGNNIHVYDPFCGLGTVPIEALHMGISHIYASDISPEMTAATSKSVSDYVARTPDMNPQNSPLNIETLDVKRIASFPSIEKVTHIVTEGYLGRIFGQYSIKSELVAEEKVHLLDIYGPMFE